MDKGWAFIWGLGAGYVIAAVGFTLLVIILGNDTIPDGCDQASIVYAPDGTHTITYECETP